MPPLDGHTYVPRGTTALLDAIGRTINTIGERPDKPPQANRPGKGMIVMFTDGLEKASKEFMRRTIYSMIKHQREKYAWEFIFLGANQDAIHAGSVIGIPASNAATFVAEPGGASEAFAAIACATAAYRASAPNYAEHLKKATKKKQSV